MAIFTSSSIWKSNMPATMKSAPLRKAWEKADVRRNRAGRHDLERDPGLGHRLHERGRLFRIQAPHVVVVAVVVAGLRLVPAVLLAPFDRRGRPVAVHVEGLDVEVRGSLFFSQAIGVSSEWAPTPAGTPCSRIKSMRQADACPSCRP